MAVQTDIEKWLLLSWHPLVPRWRCCRSHSALISSCPTVVPLFCRHTAALSIAHFLPLARAPSSVVFAVVHHLDDQVHLSTHGSHVHGGTPHFFFSPCPLELFLFCLGLSYSSFGSRTSSFLNFDASPPRKPFVSRLPSFTRCSSSFPSFMWPPPLSVSI